MDKKKKKLIIVITVILVWRDRFSDMVFQIQRTGTTSGKNAVYVDSVANLAGLSSGDGLNGRYSGY